MLGIEATLRASGLQTIAGVDEAGRGPCAGPLVIAAVILKNPNSPLLKRVRDSKVLSEKVREELFDVVKEESLAYSIIEISPVEIDEIGLHNSNIEGMRVRSMRSPLPLNMSSLMVMLSLVWRSRVLPSGKGIRSPHRLVQPQSLRRCIAIESWSRWIQDTPSMALQNIRGM